MKRLVDKDATQAISWLFKLVARLAKEYSGRSVKLECISLFDDGRVIANGADGGIFVLQVDKGGHGNGTGGGRFICWLRINA